MGGIVEVMDIDGDRISECSIMIFSICARMSGLLNGLAPNSAESMGPASGPLGRRITKRLGSGKETPVDMRGHSVTCD